MLRHESKYYFLLSVESFPIAAGKESKKYYFKAKINNLTFNVFLIHFNKVKFKVFIMTFNLPFQQFFQYRPGSDIKQKMLEMFYNSLLALGIESKFQTKHIFIFMYWRFSVKYKGLNKAVLTMDIYL